MKKKKGNENITLWWWLRWWSDWVKRCYLIKIMWWFTEPTFIDLFSIYIFTVLNMNRIMKDPIVKLTPFTWPVLKNHHGVIMVYTYVQQKNVTWWNDWFKLKSDRFGNQSGKSTLRSRVGFGSRVESKSKNLISHFFSINEMWLSKRGCSILKSMDTWINVGLENESNLGEDIGINIDLKIRIESQSCGSRSHSCSSSISLKL